MSVDIRGTTGITSPGYSGDGAPNIQSINYLPSEWSYATTSTMSIVYGTTINISKKSLVIASCTGHVKNSGANFHHGIDFGNNNLPAAFLYPQYKGYSYARGLDQWQPTSITQGEILNAGTHTISVAIGSESTSAVSSLNGSSLMIQIIEIGD